MLASIFSFPIEALVRAFFSFLTGWIADGAAAILGELGKAIDAAGSPALGGVAALSPTMLSIGAATCLPLLFLAIVQGVLRQDAGFLLRVVFVRLPAAAVLSVAALVLVGALLSVTDEMSSAILAVAGHSERHVLAGMAAVLLVAGPTGQSGFGLLLLAGTAAGVSLLLWMELAVRSAAVEVATLLCPLALAGLVWPVTSHWARRLGETLVALVFSKVVIAATLALAAATLARGGGVAGLVQGVALLALAALAPFALLRLVPIVEAGAIGHLEGLAARARRGAEHSYGRAQALARSEPAQPWSALALLGSSAGAAGPSPAASGDAGSSGGAPGGASGGGGWPSGGLVEPLGVGGPLWAGPGRDPSAPGSPWRLAAEAEEHGLERLGEAGGVDP